MVQASNERQYERTALEEETAKLADVVQYIQVERLRLEGQMPATAAHQEAAEAIQEILQSNADSLYSALDQPYFGRLDYFHKDKDDSDEADDADLSMRRIYLGIVHIFGKDVFSWTSPVGRLWYTQSMEDGYTAPRGYIATKVNLKRYIRIRSRELEGWNDIFRRLPPAPSPEQLPSPSSEQAPDDSDGRQDLLREAVSGVGSGDGHLQVIVETIEPDQYENIANVSDRVLIVQGAAGSGKSEIGLHRIAFLLSPFNDLPAAERPTPETTLFVGPSQAFLDYAADILPTLGLQEGVQRVRFSEWLSERLSVRTPIRARIWNDLLARGDLTRYDEAAETIKGSLSMADVLDKHIAATTRDIRRRCLELSPEIRGPEAVYETTVDQIRSVLISVLQSAGRGEGLNRRREQFIDQIASAVQVSERERPRRGLQELTLEGYRRERERRAEVRDAVSKWCDGAWPQIDFREEYFAVLSDPERMSDLAGDSMPEAVVAELARSAARRPDSGVDDADVGALAYLDHLLNGTIEPKYRHIVVDEAQDISPIEFKLLAASSLNNWFTVLGDTAQRLTPYRGVKNWREVERVFGRAEIEVQRARTSYRSSREITLFNNRILRTFDANISAPKPFARKGHRVEYSRYRNRAEMYQGIIDDVGRVRSLETLSDSLVAILVRDQANLNRFREFCEERGLGEIVLVGQEHHTRSRTVVGRIPDVKGLEYDVVIVMGVNEAFSDTLFNKKLLYMATTRAKHYLGIHWYGRQSPILASISDRGVNQYRP